MVITVTDLQSFGNRILILLSLVELIPTWLEDSLSLSGKYSLVKRTHSTLIQRTTQQFAVRSIREITYFTVIWVCYQTAVSRYNCDVNKHHSVVN